MVNELEFLENVKPGMKYQIREDYLLELESNLREVN